MRKAVIVMGIVTLLGLSQVREAQACKCVPPPPVATAVDQSDVVFAGRVIDVTPRGDETEGVVARIAVSRIWKGSVGETAEVRTATSSAACGLSFEAGAEWLIYGNTADGALSATLCSRSKQLAQAGEDLAELGSGTTPGDGGPPPTPPGQGGCACQLPGEQGAPWGAVAALGLAGALGMRRRRKPAS